MQIILDLSRTQARDLLRALNLISDDERLTTAAWGEPTGERGEIGFRRADMHMVMHRLRWALEPKETTIDFFGERE